MSAKKLRKGMAVVRAAHAVARHVLGKRPMRMARGAPSGSKRFSEMTGAPAEPPVAEPPPGFYDPEGRRLYRKDRRGRLYT